MYKKITLNLILHQSTIDLIMLELYTRGKKIKGVNYGSNNW